MLPGFLVGALALQIRGDLDASVEAVAAGVTVFFLAGALGAGAGRPAGRPRRARCERCAAACWSRPRACCGARRCADSLPVLLVLLALAGLANAVAQPAINLFMAEQVPDERQGLGFGIKQSGIPAAILVSGLALPLLAIPLGWRPTFAICARSARWPSALGAARAAGARPAARRPRRPSRALVLTALGAALATAGAVRAGRLPGGLGGGRGHRRGHGRTARRARAAR